MGCKARGCGECDVECGAAGQEGFPQFPLGKVAVAILQSAREYREVTLSCQVAMDDQLMKTDDKHAHVSPIDDCPRILTPRASLSAAICSRPDLCSIRDFSRGCQT
jgi:hypothetical protein